MGKKMYEKYLILSDLYPVLANISSTSYLFSYIRSFVNKQKDIIKEFVNKVFANEAIVNNKM